MQPRRRRPGAGAPPRHLDRQQHALVLELGDGLTHRPALHAPVVGEVGLGRDALRSGGMLDERANGVGLGRRRAEELWAERLLGQRVDALEPAPLDAHDVARAEHHLEGSLDVGPAPPRPAPFVGVMLDRRGGQRAVRRELGAQPDRELAVFCDPTAPIAAFRPVLGAPELEQRPELSRDVGRLMRPVLDHAPPLPVREAVEQRTIVAADPAERRQVVASLEDVDRVDLQESEPLDDPRERPACRAHRAAGARSPARRARFGARGRG